MSPTFQERRACNRRTLPWQLGMRIGKRAVLWVPQRTISQRYFSSASDLGLSGVDSSITGSLITYFSLAQLPRSSDLQRSLQNGNSACASESVGLRQIGQRHFMPKRILQTLPDVRARAAANIEKFSAN